MDHSSLCEGNHPECVACIDEYLTRCKHELPEWAYKYSEQSTDSDWVSGFYQGVRVAMYFLGKGKQ